MDLQRKIDFAIKLLQSIPQDDGPIEVSYSGGKDSDVILELAKMAGIPFEAIYKNTTIDPPGTIQHCISKGVTILRPKTPFFKLIEKKGYPTRRARFCCRELKEYKVYNRAVQGIRRSESTARAERYKEPEICREYSKKDKVRVYLPILSWSDADVEQFIRERNIRCAPVYYDSEGNFHVERRLGCIGCPMKSDCGKSDFVKYPGMLKEWIRRGKKFLDSHPDSSTVQKFGNAYNVIVHNLFFDSFEEYEKVYGGGQLFPEQIPDSKAFLEQYFGIDLTL